MLSDFNQQYHRLIRYLFLSSFLLIGDNLQAERLMEYEGRLWDDVVGDWYYAVWADGGDVEGYVRMAELVLSIEPENPAAYDILGMVKRETGDFAGALAEYNRALKIAPNFRGAYVGRGKTKRDMGDKAGGEADFAKAKELEASGLSYEAIRGAENKRYKKMMRDRRIEAEPDNLKLLSIRASQRARSGDRMGERADLEEMYRRGMGNIDSYSCDSLAVIRSNAGDIEGALQVLDDGIQYNPNAAKLYERRAKYRRRSGNETGALADEAEIEKIPDRKRWESVAALSKRIEASPRGWPNFSQRSGLYVELHEYDMAVADLREVGKLKPELEGRMDRKIRDVRREQIKRFDKNIAKNPENIALLEQRAELQIEIEDYYDAIYDLDRSIDHFPGQDRLRTLRIEAEQKREEKRQAKMEERKERERKKAASKESVRQSRLRLAEEALRESNEILEADPNNPEGYLKLANALHLQDDLKGELEAYNKAIEVDPDYSLAYKLRAGFRTRAGDMKGAKADREEAKRSIPRELANIAEKLKAKPSDLELLKRSGSLRAEMGDFGRALSDFENYYNRCGEPLNVADYSLLAQVRLAAGYPEAALATIDEVLASFPPESSSGMKQHFTSQRYRIEQLIKSGDAPVPVGGL